MAIGSPSSAPCTATNRCMAPADSGSSSSTGAVSGVTSAVASCCAPSPTRTCPKSASLIRRSHTRLAASPDGRAPASTARVHNWSGAGCR